MKTNDFPPASITLKVKIERLQIKCILLSYRVVSLGRGLQRRTDRKTTKVGPGGRGWGRQSSIK